MRYFKFFFIISLVLTHNNYARNPSEKDCIFGTLTDHSSEDGKIRWTAKGITIEKISHKGIKLSVSPAKKGTFVSLPLPIEPLTLYSVNVRLKRGPGTKVIFFVIYNEGKKEKRRGICLQRVVAPTATHIPLCPWEESYCQNFCLPEGAKNAKLEVKLEGHKKSDFNFLELWDFKISQVSRVVVGKNLGKDLLLVGNMEMSDKAGKHPFGWNICINGDNASIETNERKVHTGKKCLKIIPRKWAYVFQGQTCPVERGKAYQLSFWAKGQGTLTGGAHSLAIGECRAMPVRVGDPQSDSLTIKNEKWQQFKLIWFAEAPHSDQTRVFFVVNTPNELLIDDVTFREFVPNSSKEK